MKNLLAIIANARNESNLEDIPLILQKIVSNGNTFLDKMTFDTQELEHNILASSSKKLSLLFFENLHYFLKNKLFVMIHRKTRQQYNESKRAKYFVSAVYKTGNFYIVSLQRLKSIKIYSTSNEEKTRKSDRVIDKPSIRKSIVSETIYSAVTYPGADAVILLLCQSLLKLNLYFNDSLFSPERMVKKLTTKESAPDGNEKGDVADPTHFIYVVLGWSGEQPAESIEVYDANAKKWSFFQQETPFMRAYHGVAILGSCLYIIGGFNGHTCLATTLCLNIRSRHWSKGPYLSMPRCYVLTLAFKEHIYAIGGHNGQNRLKSCEKFDPKRKKWIRVSDMMYRRSDTAGAEINGKILVCGGFDGFQFHSTTEMYDPESDQWTLVGNLLNPRSGHCMVSIDGEVFALGGFNGRERLREVEKFNGEANQWENFIPMLNGRSNFCCVTFRQEIFAIGGYDGRSTISSVEKLNKSVMEWQKGPSLNLHRSAAGACVMDYSGSVSACGVNELVPVVSENIEEPSP